MVFLPLYQQLAVIVLFLREVWRATLGVAIGIVSFSGRTKFHETWTSLFTLSFFFTRSPCCFDSIVSFLNASSLLVPEEWWVFTLCSAYGGRNLPLVLTFFYCFVHPVPTNKFFFFFLPLVSNLKLHSCVFAFSFPLQRRPLSCKMFGL